jgi:hypothetical protein
LQEQSRIWIYQKDGKLKSYDVFTDKEEEVFNGDAKCALNANEAMVFIPTDRKGALLCLTQQGKGWCFDIAAKAWYQAGRWALPSKSDTNHLCFDNQGGLWVHIKGDSTFRHVSLDPNENFTEPDGKDPEPGENSSEEADLGDLFG